MRQKPNKRKHKERPQRWGCGRGGGRPGAGGRGNKSGLYAHAIRCKSKRPSSSRATTRGTCPTARGATSNAPHSSAPSVPRTCVALDTSPLASGDARSPALSALSVSVTVTARATVTASSSCMSTERVRELGTDRKYDHSVQLVHVD